MLPAFLRSQVLHEGPRARVELITCESPERGPSGDEERRALIPGKVGRLLHDRARGVDPRGIEPQTEAVSISTEETFERDVADRAQLHAELRRMAGRLAEHLASTGGSPPIRIVKIDNKGRHNRRVRIGLPRP